MAQLLAPLAASAVDYDASPTIDPPPTTFPYPEDPTSSQSVSRGTSDATLHSVHVQTNVDNAAAEKKRAQDDMLQSPQLALTKFQTEITPRATPTFPTPVRQGRSTLDHPHRRHSLSAQDLSDSDTLASSDDDSLEALDRAQTQPLDHALHKSHLNKVKPRRTRPDHLKVGNEFFRSQGRLAKDGRLNISVNETTQTGYLAKALGATIEHHIGHHHNHETRRATKSPAEFQRNQGELTIPRLNIVIMIIGSRGDLQPFLKIGKLLKDKYNHRIRIATHPTFKKFIEEEMGLECFNVGGDPAELMSFMVKNPGLIPSLETVKAGEIGRRRDSMYEMFQGFWRACINATDNAEDIANLKMVGKKAPFVADAIIANPPSFAHYHCAERLGIPLHLVFTFPYSPTQAFAHPLANVKSSNVDQRYTNFMSYPLVDLLIWQGTGDLVNRFRVHTLGLEPVSTLWAPGQISRLKVPMTYLWSPKLVPKPSDWGPEIDIAGYVFLDLAKSYKPPEDLAHFLERTDGRSIVYIGFGSISGIDDPVAFTRMIFDAVEKAGVRAIISRGWGGMGDGMDKPDGIFLVDNVPHDWLFPKVDAVVHHGGAGTTAAGLKFRKPTMIVPFFGDQPFWGNMVARAGAGAREALPLKKLDADKLAEGIRQCLEPEAKTKAQEIAESIEEEGDGAENVVDSFHRALQLEDPDHLRCSIFPDRIAVWQIKHASTRLSAFAADVLVETRQLQWSDLELVKNREWTDFSGPGEPITGAGGVIVQAFREACHGLSEIPDTAKRDVQQSEKRRRKRKDLSAVEGLVLPGRIALATKGTSVEAQRCEHNKIVREFNLQGEAQPLKLGETAPLVSDEASPAVLVLKDIGKGVGHSSKAIATLPLQMWNALAVGFHNAPRLYGDKTVRPSPQGPDGFRSGCKVAGKQFCLEIYDGVTGVVRIPYLEVNEAGMTALPKGMARGFGGLVLKPVAGVLGLGAYSAKGLHNSLRRRVRDTKKTERWIRQARIAQGQKEAQELQDRKATGPAHHHTPSPTELAQLRNEALRLWTTVEKEKIVAEQETEKGLRSLRAKARPTRTG